MTCNSATRMAVAIVVATGLVGCRDPAEVTVHRPGVYKGRSDPLLAQEISVRTKVLMERFRLVQRDR